MNPGKLDQRITIRYLKTVEDLENEGNPPQKVLTDLCTVWAEFGKPKTTSDLQNGGFSSVLTHTVNIRYRDDVQMNYQIFVGTKIYKVLHVYHTDREITTLICKEISQNDQALKELIKVYRKTSVRSSGGGREENEVFICHLWAIVTAITSDDKFLAMKDSEVRTHEVRVVLTDEEPLQYGDILHWRDIKLDVRGLIPDHEIGLLIAECVCRND